MTFGEQPAYLRVAGDLRKKIVDGQLPPHTRLPSQARIREEYGVSDTVALEARKVLMAEGLVEVGILREGSEITLPVTLQASDRGPR